MEIIRIFGTDYKLKFKKRLREDSGIQSLYGSINYMTNKIKVDSKIEAQKVYQTIWHEVLHGICNHASVELSEEDTIRVAEGIAQVLRDNQEVLNKYFPWGKR